MEVTKEQSEQEWFLSFVRTNRKIIPLRYFFPVFCFETRGRNTGMVLKGGVFGTVD